ncbi:uncharacterized protein LOC111131619 [Crassostrea virginica]
MQISIILSLVASQWAAIYMFPNEKLLSEKWEDNVKDWRQHLTGIKQSVRQKRGVERALSSVRDFMQLIGKAYSYPTEEKKRAHININNSLDFAVSDFTQHMRPHLSRLLGKIRGLQTEGAGIGDNAHATISHLQDSIGKIVSDIDGTIDQRARRIQ